MSNNEIWMFTTRLVVRTVIYWSHFVRCHGSAAGNRLNPYVLCAIFFLLVNAARSDGICTSSASVTKNVLSSYEIINAEMCRNIRVITQTLRNEAREMLKKKWSMLHSISEFVIVRFKFCVKENYCQKKEKRKTVRERDRESVSCACKVLTLFFQFLDLIEEF